MSRENALLLAKIWKIEKEYKRPIYPQELWKKGVCSSKQCNNIIAELTNKGMLIEQNERGANTYRISNLGFSQMETYLDIKREM